MIRTAISGLGIRGKLFAQGLKQNPQATLVSVCDTNKDSLAAATAQWEVAGYVDFEQMLDEQRPEAVLICTPDFAHCESVITAAHHGIHVMVEKPLATSEQEARHMLAAVQTSGITCQVAFENRWNPPFVHLKQAVVRGDLGAISLINARLSDTRFVPTRMLSWANKSTVGWFLLPHVVDLALWLSGTTPSRVYAVATKQVLPSLGIDTYDTICTVLSFNGGLQAIFETTWILPESLPSLFDFKFDILGDKAFVHVDVQNQMIQQSADRFTYPGTLLTDIHGQTRGFPLFMLDSFIDSVRNGTKPLATIEEGYKVTRVIDAVHRSIVSGQAVDL